MGPFFEADKSLAQEIVRELFKRQRINANKKIGSLSTVAQCLDEVNPSLFIHHDEIKDRTGRTQMRESAYECLRAHFPLFPVHTEIERDLDGTPTGLTVSVMAVRSEDNEFKSLSQLQSANRADLEHRPQLDRPIR